MFDVGFSELLLIGVIALLVLGPERLPKVARTAGHWVGRARRFVANVKADIEQEIKAEELKKVLNEQAKATGVHEIIEEARDGLDSLNKPDYLLKASADEPTTVTQSSAIEKPAAGKNHDNP